MLRSGALAMGVSETVNGESNPLWFGERIPAALNGYRLAVVLPTVNSQQ